MNIHFVGIIYINTRILMRDIYFVECILFMVLHFLLTSDGNIYRLMVLTFTLLVLVFAIIISSNVVLSNTQTQNVWPSTFQMHTRWKHTQRKLIFMSYCKLGTQCWKWMPFNIFQVFLFLLGYSLCNLYEWVKGESSAYISP